MRITITSTDRPAPWGQHYAHDQHISRSLNCNQIITHNKPMFIDIKGQWVLCRNDNAGSYNNNNQPSHMYFICTSLNFKGFTISIFIKAI